MEKSLVPMVYNELCITNVEYQGCFIKIWANSRSKEQEYLENNLQKYTSYSKVFYCYIIIHYIVLSKTVVPKLILIITIISNCLL